VSVPVATDSPAPATPRGQSPQLWANLQAILSAHDGTEPIRLLDCGGGSGSLAVPLAVGGADVTVVDVSIDALGTLLRRAAEAGVSDRVTAVQGEAESLKDLLDGAEFDLVLAHEVLENVASVPAALAQITGVLRPRGVVSIVVGNPVAVVIGRALSGDVAGALANVREPPVSSISVAELEQDCAAAGLTVERVDGLGVFTEIVPGIDLERPGAMKALIELEEATAGLAPYRDIASRTHLVARRSDAVTR
jgi:S-adenosylmethionine-dependent methyltransferase